MNPQNSKLITIIGVVGMVATGVVGFPEWAALGTVGHWVVIACGIISGAAMALGKALGAPAA